MATFNHYVHSYWHHARRLSVRLSALVCLHSSFCTYFWTSRRLFLGNFARQDVLFLTNLLIQPTFLSSVSCFNLLFYVLRRLLCLIFACRLVFLHVILRFKTSFSWQLSRQDVLFLTNLRIYPSFLSSVSCFNLLFCISRRLLCLIFACRLVFLHIILRFKTSFS